MSTLGRTPSPDERAYVAASGVPGHPEEDFCNDCEPCPDCAGLGSWWAGPLGGRVYESCAVCSADGWVHYVSAPARVQSGVPTRNGSPE